MRASKASLKFSNYVSAVNTVSAACKSFTHFLPRRWMSDFDLACRQSPAHYDWRGISTSYAFAGGWGVALGCGISVEIEAVEDGFTARVTWGLSHVTVPYLLAMAGFDFEEGAAGAQAATKKWQLRQSRRRMRDSSEDEYAAKIHVLDKIAFHGEYGNAQPNNLISYYCTSEDVNRIPASASRMLMLEMAWAFAAQAKENAEWRAATRFSAREGNGENNGIRS